MVRDLRCSELSSRLEGANPLVLVDVREDWELEICAIAGAIHIPLGQLIDRVGEITPEKPVALLCHHGVRSRHAAILLEDCGFKDVFNVAGGIDVWALEIDPDMTRYD